MVTTNFQYYEYLYALQVEDSGQTANGSWTKGGEAWQLKAACREETNGKGSTIQTADGRILVFSSLIQLPKGTERINEGTKVVVTREPVDVAELLNVDFIKAAKASGLIVASGTCEKYDSGRLHCRMWI